MNLESYALYPHQVTESAYADAKSHQPDAWNRYWYLPGKQALKVEVISSDEG